MSSIASGTTTTTALVQTADTTGNLLLQTGSTPTTAVTIDTSQNVGVGVTPSAWSTSNSVKAMQFTQGALWGYSTTNMFLGSNYYFNGTNRIYSTTAAVAEYSISTGIHAWFNAPSGTVGTNATLTQAMTLDNSGNLLIGTTSALNSTNTFSGSGTWNLVLNNTGQYTQFGFLNNGTTKAAQYWDNTAGRFYVYAGGASYGVYLATNGVVWVSNSDERLKEIIEPISDATSKVSSLRAVIGKYKIDEEGTRRSFLIAQDVQKVLPEAVDASDPDKLGVAYTDVIPLLVAAIQELSAKVTALEAKVGA